MQCCNLLSSALWYLGHPDQALQRSHDAHTLALELAHPFSRVTARYYAAKLHQSRGEVHATYEHADATVALAMEHGFTQFVAMGMVLRGWALALQDEGEAGIAQIEQGLATYQATGSVLARPSFLPLLIDAYQQKDGVDDGLDVVTEGLALTNRTGLRYPEAEISRCKGELLLQRAVTDVAEAETCFHQALDVARVQQAKSWELRAATSLARLWQSRGKGQEAHDLLAPVYAWFTEGFDTADVQEAKALLVALG